MKDDVSVVRFKKGNVYYVETSNSDKNGLLVMFERFCNEDECVCRVMKDLGRYLKGQMVICNRLEIRNAEEA